MRTLNEYFLTGGAMSAIQTADNKSANAVVPDGGVVRSCIINVHTVIDADTTFDVLVNGTDSTIDCTLPDETVDETGYEMVLPTALAVAIGDSLILQSNGEQEGACLADITWVIRR